jgi:AcrR family transcriptional regulator
MATNRRAEQAERRRDQLIDVALDLFAEHGIDATPISKIAEKAGVAQGLLYHYFPGKEALLSAIIERHSPLPLVREALTSLPDKPARETITSLAARIYTLMQERRAIVRLALRDGLWRPEVREIAMRARETALGILARYLQSRVAAGELRPHDSMVVAQTIASAVFVAAIAGLPFDPNVTGAIDVILRGVAADPIADLVRERPLTE